MIDVVLGSGHFETPSSVAIIVERVPYGDGPEDDVLLLQVLPRDGSPAARSFTTVEVLSLSLDTGSWWAREGDEAMALKAPRQRRRLPVDHMIDRACRWTPSRSVAQQ
ncbi:hypothetical protein [Sphingomonas sp. CFBP 8760]|uniref:hypothetical protein n=1 Tax=Sphingomonas sp. CFBP 8760 TaxID=2775282 RepID=UPI0017854090|nr:hypothetical protein [Sphingomonas sp. CFBP 8760]MBD8548831.1 hypothetical protein [Sphingomonas sp. CFBP 8760]